MRNSISPVFVVSRETRDSGFNPVRYVVDEHGNFYKSTGYYASVDTGDFYRPTRRIWQWREPAPCSVEDVPVPDRESCRSAYAERQKAVAAAERQKAVAAAERAGKGACVCPVCGHREEAPCECPYCGEAFCR